MWKCVVFLFCFVRGGDEEEEDEEEEEEEKKRRRRCRTKRPCGHASLALGLSIGHETFFGEFFLLSHAGTACPAQRNL